jgi:transcriptional regulator with XRE-family HTH domain
MDRPPSPPRPQPYKPPFRGTRENGRDSSPVYLTEWGAVVGDRVRRLRRDRDMTLAGLGRAIVKPEGGHFSPGYVSKLERGWTSAALYAYLAIAAVLEVDPGKLLGPDNAAFEVDADEAVLLRWLRARRIPAHEALLALTDPEAPP